MSEIDFKPLGKTFGKPALGSRNIDLPAYESSRLIMKEVVRILENIKKSLTATLYYTRLYPGLKQISVDLKRLLDSRTIAQPALQFVMLTRRFLEHEFAVFGYQNNISGRTVQSILINGEAATLNEKTDWNDVLVGDSQLVKLSARLFNRVLLKAMRSIFCKAKRDKLTIPIAFEQKGLGSEIWNDFNKAFREINIEELRRFGYIKKVQTFNSDSRDWQPTHKLKNAFLLI